MDAATSKLSLPPVPRADITRYWLAYSGGMDSSVLLHALHAAGVPGLAAVHVHHGLQPAADDWAEHCRARSEHLGVPFTLCRVTVNPDDHDGPEAAARKARYDALRQLVLPGDCLITAHHMDDQAETVLLRLLRGAGIQGLAAMRDFTPHPPLHLWRPLLQTPRAVIEAYAREYGLNWIEDPHNREPRYARSWLRTQAMPVIQAQYPHAAQSLARAARHAQEAVSLLDEVADADLAQALIAGPAADDTRSGLSVAKLMAFTPARRRNVLRYWLLRRGLDYPSSRVLCQLEEEVMLARADAQPLLQCGHDDSAYQFRRYRDGLFVTRPLPPEPPQEELRWCDTPGLELPPGCGRLTAGALPPQGLRVGFPKGGERIRPLGSAQSKTLKTLFQDRGVPLWVRQRTPVIYLDTRLAQVGNFWRTQAAQPLDCRWLPPPELEPWLVAPAATAP